MRHLLSSITAVRMKTRSATGEFKQVCLSSVASSNGNKVAAVTGGNVPPSLPSGSLGNLKDLLCCTEIFPTGGSLHKLAKACYGTPQCSCSHLKSGK